MKGVVGGTNLVGPTNKVEGTMFGPGCMNDLLFNLIDPVTRHEAAFEKACSYDATVVEAVKSLWDIPHDAAEVAKCCRSGNCRELTLEEATFKKKYNKAWNLADSNHPKDWGVCSLLCLSYASFQVRGDTKSMVYSSWEKDLSSDVFTRSDSSFWRAGRGWGVGC